MYIPNTDTFALDYLGPIGQSIGQNVFPYGFHTNGVYAVPLTGDFNGDGVTDVGTYQPNNDYFALNYLAPNKPSIGQYVFNYAGHSASVYATPLPSPANELTASGTIQAASVSGASATAVPAAEVRPVTAQATGTSSAAPTPGATTRLRPNTLVLKRADPLLLRPKTAHPRGAVAPRALNLLSRRAVVAW